MPALSHSGYERSIELPPRTARLAAETEVLVVGGGPAGIAASIGAARAGAKVLLAEQFGFLGGTATNALTMPMMAYHAHQPAVEPLQEGRLLPEDRGPGHPVIEGVLKEFVDRMVTAGGALAPKPETGFVVPFDPEIYKQIAIEMVDEAGVDILLHATASGVVGDGVRDGVVFETKSGPLVIKARVVIDGTGDDDVAAQAGARYEVGRSSDGLTQPLTVMFRMGNFSRTAFTEYCHKHPDQWRGVHGLWQLIDKATNEGQLHLTREDVMFFASPHENEVSVNSTRVTRVSGIDVWDLTRAEIEGHRQMHEIARFLQHYVPGFERAYILESGPTIMVRETRRIVGDYCLTEEDVMQARKFDDVVARCCYPMDIHNPEGKGTQLTRMPPGEAYDIPLRCLLPQGVDDLLVAGHGISGTHEAQSSFRVMPVSYATGHAAGVCAALAVRQGVTPRAVDVAAVQEELLRQGANLAGRPH